MNYFYQEGFVKDEDGKSDASYKVKIGAWVWLSKHVKVSTSQCLASLFLHPLPNRSQVQGQIVMLVDC